MILLRTSEKMNALCNELSLRWDMPLADAKRIVPEMNWIGSRKGNAEVFMAIDEGRNQVIVAEWIGGDGFHDGPLAGENWPQKWNIGEVRLINPTTI